ncbi:MAG: 50S ribosomal protein L11 methyltransferase [Ruminococcaceae bacterium]|nr:50S ribosomal protein L11 methyltransferase [Oscillospiraceae bacterium]
MNWTEITITVPQKDTDEAAAIANMTVPYGIYIEDYSDLEEKAEEIAHINLIDEELIAKDRTTSLIHIYISECDNAMEAVEFLKERFRAANIDFTVNFIGVNDADWNENWKKYFHVSEIGEKLVIVPSWEEYENKQGRVVLNIDPGAAFGTGTHATTSLCLTLLEKHINSGVKMLDIGTGSGILAIASTLLGAKSAIGVDIDAQSVKTAKENAEINNVQDKCEFIVGDLADKISGKFNVICANIVADVIIKLFDNVADFMEDDAVLIISGIIDLRKDDVLNSALAHGFKIVEENYKDNWCAFTLKK